MKLKALFAAGALLWASPASADNFVLADALGNFVTIACTMAAGVCTIATTGGGGGGGGDASAANQTTMIGHMDGLEGFVDGLEGFTDGLETLIGTSNTSLTTIDGRVDGLEALVDGIEALIGTTNTTLTTIDGRVDGVEALITSTNGFVDGLETLTGSGATGLGKAESSAHTTADKGILLLGVRQDSQSDFCADGQYCPVRIDADGNVATTAGAGASGDIGVEADTVCATDTGSCNVIELLKKVAANITTQTDSLSGTATVASAVEGSVAMMGVANDEGLTAGTPGADYVRGCDTTAVIDTAAIGNTQLVALTTSETIFICGWQLTVGGAVSVQWIYGTGSACATGETDLTAAMPFLANGDTWSDTSVFYKGMKGALSNAFCIELSAAVQTSGVLYYTKY